MELKYLFLILAIFSLTGCEIYDAAVQQAVDQTQTEIVSNTKQKAKSPTQERQSISLSSPTPTSEKPHSQNSCIPASSITSKRLGETIDVFGVVTNTGKEPCPNCANGYYSYVVLDNSFFIISYDWIFNSSMIGDCIRVKDIVEPFGANPAFVFGAKEGYDGSKCEYGEDGTLWCREGNYLQSCSGCR